MTYQPRTKSSYVKGDNGIAKVRFSTDHKKVQVVFMPQEEGQQGKSIILDRDACPDNLQPGEWMVNISGLGDKMLSFRPVIGNFVVTTKSFASAEGEEPKPKTKDVKFEKAGKVHEYSYDYFTVLWEILEPEKYKGIEVPYMLRYHFEPDEFEGKQVVAYSKGGSKYTDYLKEYLNVAGVWEYGVLEWKDNVLPDLQKRILHTGVKFQITMKEGWVVPGSLLPYDEPDAENDDMIFDAEEAEKALSRATPEEPSFPEGDIPFEPGEEEFVD
ncbi:MAG: hypothetical protein KKF27_21125 [Gammaproteobacteria bacterium]|nr:hypothetical protein [Gammaproteobacteria bacterium]